MLKLAPLLLVAGLALVASVPLIPPLREVPLELEQRQTNVQYRLPNDTFPLHYKVHLNTRVDEADFSFTGSVEIQIQILAPTQTITLHSRSQTIQSVKLYKLATPAVEIEIEPFELEASTEFLIVKTVSELLMIADTYQLVIEYSATLDFYLGFYRAYYTAEDGTTRYLATTHFEPTDARHAFPCYDEPVKRSVFDISITHGAKYHAVSNMPVKNVIPIGEGETVTTVFESTVNMPTYLLAFVVSDYAYLEAENSTPLQRVYSQPPKIEDSHYILEAGVAIMKGLEDYLDVSYPIAKMDQFAIPQFLPAAMENWGLVTYGENYFHWNNETYKTSDQLGVASVVAHEYAHQWFGNLVTPKWWTYLWLSEGFVTLFQHEGLEFAYPEIRYNDLFTTDHLQPLFSRDSADTTRPMTHYVESPGEIQSQFGDIAYSKSGCVLRMIKHFISEPVWKQGLKNYFNEMAYKAAEPEDLFRGLQTAVTAASIVLPTDLKNILDTWTTRRGYPVVGVHRHYDAAGNIHLTQTRFLDATHTDPEKITYYVPVNVASKSRPNFEVTTADLWFDGLESHYTPATADVVAKDDWLLVNKQQAFYYRVNYDDDNWLLLGEALLAENFDKIHLLNRAQLLDDALDLARFDHLDYTVALHIVKYLSKETQYVPWRAADPGLTELYRLMRDSESSGHFNHFISEISEPVYKSLGATRRDSDDHHARLNRVLAMKWACRSGVAACLDDTNAVLKTYVNDGATLDPDLETAIFCHGMRKADQTLFDAFWAKALAATSSTTRSNILSSLGCNENEEILEAAVHKVIVNAGNSLTTAEQRTFINGVYQNSGTGLHLILHLLEAEATLAQIKTIYGTTFATFLNTYANYVTTTHYSEGIEEVLTKSDDITESAKTTIRNRMKANLDFVSSKGVEVATFLKDYYEGAAVAVVASFAMVMIAALTSYSLL